MGIVSQQCLELYHSAIPSQQAQRSSAAARPQAELRCATIATIAPEPESESDCRAGATRSFIIAARAIRSVDERSCRWPRK